MTGLFIVLEGIDGCGKGTQMKRLANTLFDMNKRHHVFMTREPGRSQKPHDSLNRLSRGGQGIRPNSLSSRSCHQNCRRSRKDRN